MTQNVPISEIVGCTCLRLRKAARCATQIYDRCLEPAGLTITQFGLLAHLHALRGMSIGELAEALIMDPTTLTRNLRPLEKRGLVRIKASKDDRRRREVALTANGRAALDTAAPLWRQAQTQIAAALGREEVASLNQVLDRSLDRLVTM